MNSGSRAEGSEIRMMSYFIYFGCGNHKWLEPLDKLFEAVAGVVQYMITGD